MISTAPPAKASEGTLLLLPRSVGLVCVPFLEKSKAFSIYATEKYADVTEAIFLAIDFSGNLNV